VVLPDFEEDTLHCRGEHLREQNPDAFGDLTKNHRARPDHVPVERVRLQNEKVTEEEPVSAEVRKEQIDTAGVDTMGTAPTQ
jgi:hypothetical protein